MRDRSEAYFKKYIEIEEGEWKIVVPHEEYAHQGLLKEWFAFAILIYFYRIIIMNNFFPFQTISNFGRPEADSSQSRLLYE